MQTVCSIVLCVFYTGVAGYECLYIFFRDGDESRKLMEKLTLYEESHMGHYR